MDTSYGVEFQNKPKSTSRESKKSLKSVIRLTKRSPPPTHTLTDIKEKKKKFKRWLPEEGAKGLVAIQALYCLDTPEFWYADMPNPQAIQ